MLEGDISAWPPVESAAIFQRDWQRAQADSTDARGEADRNKDTRGRTKNQSGQNGRRRRLEPKKAGRLNI